VRLQAIVHRPPVGAGKAAAVCRQSVARVWVAAAQGESVPHVYLRLAELRIAAKPGHLLHQQPPWARPKKGGEQDEAHMGRCGSAACQQPPARTTLKARRLPLLTPHPTSVLRRYEYEIEDLTLASQLATTLQAAVA